MQDKNTKTYQGTVARIIAYEILKLPHTCEVCGAQGRTEVHHINKDRTDNSRENLKILCRRCHLDVHGIIPPRKQPLVTSGIDGRMRPDAAAKKQALLDKRRIATEIYRQKYGIPE